MSPGIAFQFWLTDGDRRILGEEDADCSLPSRARLLESVAMELSIGVEDVREALARIRDDCGKKIAGGPETRCHLTEYGKALLDEFSNKQAGRGALANLSNGPAADGIVLVDGDRAHKAGGSQRRKYALPGGFVEHGSASRRCGARGA